MKFLVATILVFLISFSSFAKTENYNCKLVDKNHKGKMLVSFQQCKLTPVTASFDICKIKSSTLIIGINSTQSVLVKKRGKTYEVSCYEYDDTVPEEEQEPRVEEPKPEVEEDEDQQQQQQQQQAEPGHGGSNIRGRGKVKVKA